MQNPSRVPKCDLGNGQFRQFKNRILPRTLPASQATPKACVTFQARWYSYRPGQWDSEQPRPFPTPWLISWVEVAPPVIPAQEWELGGGRTFGEKG